MSLAVSALLAAVGAQNLVAQGPYSTTRISKTVGGFQTVNNTNQDAFFVYPTAAGKFPFVVFGHGMTAGNDYAYTVYSQLISDVASHGYVVCAPKSLPNAYSQEFYKDLLRCMQFVKSDELAAKVDFSFGMGVYGHSMGSNAAIKASASQYAAVYNISAMVALHSGPVSGSPDGSLAATNALFLTGTKDTTLPPAGSKSQYLKSPASNKGYIELSSATHIEPTSFGAHRWNPVVAGWFDCYIKGDKPSCSAVRNQGAGAACASLYAGKTTECVL
ncbi:hypothetical protein HDV03_001618 [Kappamyces sp. JEL0829]|nr:hypothetical protein HDV03_001618 [Kappamyces sp. JEL0829]